MKLKKGKLGKTVFGTGHETKFGMKKTGTKWTPKTKPLYKKIR